MPSFPKIWRDEYVFGKREYSIGLFNVLPQYSDENILQRIMELGRHLHIPEFIYNNSAWFLYVSSKLEKDLIHQKNVNNVTHAQAAVAPKMRRR